jgi:hypothetical protein
MTSGVTPRSTQASNGAAPEALARPRNRLRKFAVLLAATGIALLASELAARWTRSDERLMTSALFFQESYPEVHRIADDWFLHYDLKPGAHLEAIGYWKNPYHMGMTAVAAEALQHAW